VEVCHAANWDVACTTILKIDTQCKNANFVSPDFVEKLQAVSVPLDRQLTIAGLGGAETVVDHKVDLAFRTAKEVLSNRREYQASFFVLELNERYGLLLGTPDCIDFDVIGRAALVLKVKKKGKGT